ncbi:hypothetical protein [uncultured Amphritea sp.]|uniref:hypothetical protein n=1 Tax=uncultured Amphritea sp. TaxID=981605 RepID=UPI0026156856|nr:hypothetical protein [uncultured Amphritea sp.]
MKFYSCSELSHNAGDNPQENHKLNSDLHKFDLLLLSSGLANDVVNGAACCFTRQGLRVRSLSYAEEVELNNPGLLLDNVKSSRMLVHLLPNKITIPGWLWLHMGIHEGRSPGSVAIMPVVTTQLEAVNGALLAGLTLIAHTDAGEQHNPCLTEALQTVVTPEIFALQKSCWGLAT